MDLRSIINTDVGDRPVPPKQITPVTPVQSHPQQGFREYSHPSHASPSGKHPSQDYGPGPYASPKPYPGNYPGRPPPPPPIQAPPQNDLRSPIRSSYSAQSPYQHTPSSSLSSGQYPFPPSHQTPQSPAQHQHYPPSFPQQRDIYANPNPPQHHPRQNSHTRTSPVPQTPPIGIPGAPHPYLQHQRSHSSVSTSTPTSAQSQPPHFNQYIPQDSPVSAGPYPHSQIPLPARQQSIQSQQSQHSQPGTPLGPPLRQLSGGFAQPTSPYQQRGIPPGPFPNYQQTSPAPVPQRLPSTPTVYDSRRDSIISEHQSRSQSSRERSLSVSPKTRLPSQPTVEMPPYPQQDIFSPTKRKMEDVEMAVEAPRHIYQPEVKEEPNGNGHRASSSTASPQQPPKKKIRYVEPPIWAQSVRKHVGGARGVPKVNGKQHMPSPAPTSAPIKVETNGHRQPSPFVPQGEPVGNDSEPHPSMLLGPWETSISGKKPMQEIVKRIADWIFINVIQRGDLGELSSHGVEIEIEAKLGQFIDQGTRIHFPVTTEAIFSGGGDIRFQSAMTEQQHRVLNDFLNAQVKQAHPQNPGRSKSRVPIAYLHRREHDKFYALPRDIFNSLPPAVRQQHNPNHSSKIRVTYDQKTNQILAKIIKVRIADLNIFLPSCPLDCRISINFELNYDGNIDDIIAESTIDRSNDRSKDRLSYTQGNYQVDLTQVTKTRKHNGVDIAEKEHELEIELNANMVKEQGQRVLSGQPDEYQSLIEGFMDNIRVLARAVPPAQ